MSSTTRRQSPSVLGNQADRPTLIRHQQLRPGVLFRNTIWLTVRRINSCHPTSKSSQVNAESSSGGLTGPNCSRHHFPTSSPAISRVPDPRQQDSAVTRPRTVPGTVLALHVCVHPLQTPQTTRYLRQYAIIMIQQPTPRFCSTLASQTHGGHGGHGAWGMDFA